MARKRSCDVIPPAEGKVIWRTLEETGFATPRHAVTVCARGQKRGQERSRESIGHGSIRSQCGSCIHRSRRAGHSLRLNVLLTISASTGREKYVLFTADVQGAFLKREFQDRDRVVLATEQRPKQFRVVCCSS